MAGVGELELVPHSFIEQFAPDRYTASVDQVYRCALAIIEASEVVSEGDYSPALRYGMGEVIGLAAHLAESPTSLDALLGWYKLDFQLKNNLAQLDLSEVLTVSTNQEVA